MTDHALRNLKHGDAFAVLQAHGNIGTLSDTAEGLYFRDTRFLSRLELRVEGNRPFARYYGTIDATPLFVMLHGAKLLHRAKRPTVIAGGPFNEAWANR